jgi:hypothetical protein
MFRKNISLPSSGKQLAVRLTLNGLHGVISQKMVLFNRLYWTELWYSQSVLVTVLWRVIMNMLVCSHVELTGVFWKQVTTIMQTASHSQCCLNITTIIKMLILMGTHNFWKSPNFWLQIHHSMASVWWYLFFFTFCSQFIHAVNILEWIMLEIVI